MMLTDHTKSEQYQGLLIGIFTGALTLALCTWAFFWALDKYLP